jgi:hypothetical protein
MARLLIVTPEADFRPLFAAAMAQAGYVAVEAANSYEGQPAADTARRAETRRPRRAPGRAHLLLVEATAQFDAFFRDVLAQEGYVVTAAVQRSAEPLAADAPPDIRYLVIY